LWTEAGSPTGQGAYGVAYGLDGSGNSLWVVVGGGFGSSSNGTIWTSRGTQGIFSVGNRVSYGNGLWVAVGSGGNSFASSTNGTIWTARGYGPFDTEGFGVAYADNLWIAVGQGTTDSIAMSTDGTTWTGIGGKTGLFSDFCRGISYGNGLWVAVGSGSCTIATSTNGTIWTSRFSSGVGYDVTYSNVENASVWLAVGTFGIKFWFLTASSPTNKDNRFSLSYYIKLEENTQLFRPIHILLVLNNLSLSKMLITDYLLKTPEPSVLVLTPDLLDNNMVL